MPPYEYLDYFHKIREKDLNDVTLEMELVSGCLLKLAFTFCPETSSVPANQLHTIVFPKRLKTACCKFLHHKKKTELNGK